MTEMEDCLGANKKYICNNVKDMLNNNTESYNIMKEKRFSKVTNNIDNNPSNDNNTEKKVEDPFDYIPTRKNSIKLYKDRKKRRKKTKELSNNENNIRKPSSKKINDKSNKKHVNFPFPNFAMIIDVESYKKFNAENTSKDPYEDVDEQKVSFNCTCNIF